MKVVINSDYGGFGLSAEAIREYGQRTGLNLIQEGPDRFGFIHFYRNSVSEENYFLDRDIPRDDRVLVEIVEEMGEKAGSRFSTLKVIEVPDGVNWYVEESDGREWVAERHRTWA